jgi:VWFA-related protein
MNIQIQFPAQPQGRKATARRSRSLVCAQSHSLKNVRCAFASLRLCGTLLLLAFTLTAAVLIGSGTANAQTAEDIIRVQTRVVFLDALVKEKRTGQNISDLKLENFQVFDDGKPRPISYFTREGQARKPLALVLILDLREDGAGRFLKRPEVLKSMTDELAKLPPEDEVAILAINMNTQDSTEAVIKNGKALWLTDFTRDRGQLATALSRVPALIVGPPMTDAQKAAKEQEEKAKGEQKKGSMTVTTSTDGVADAPKESAKASNGDAKAQPTPDNVLETETIKGKNGAVITRTVKKDGSVDVKRVSANGKMVVEWDDTYDMASAVRDASKTTAEKRPNSQASIVWVSDGIAPVFFEDRDATEQLLIRSNVIFSSLTVDLRTLFKFVLPLAKPIGGWMGMSFYGSAKRMAQQSGGEAVRVGRVSDYGSGMARIIGNLTARYSLGFSLGEEEKDDGKLHSLEVRVKAEDAKGKTRKLFVTSRQGYYMPGEAKEATVSRAQ